MKYHRELRYWIVAVIKQRNVLLNQGKNRKNLCLMQSNISFLKRYLDAYSYDSDEKISRFFISNKHRIHSLLPGEGSGSHVKKEKEYYMYLNRCNQILNYGEDLYLRTGFRSASRQGVSQVRQLGI